MPPQYAIMNALGRVHWLAMGGLDACDSVGLIGCYCDRQPTVPVRRSGGIALSYLPGQDYGYPGA